MMTPLLEILGLKAYYSMHNGFCRAVDGISFKIIQGENFGLVGESGCGKSTVVKSIIKVFPKYFRIEGGKILFKGKDLVPLSYNEMRKVRWEEISVIPQSAMNALNPVYKVGIQIKEAILEHEDVSSKEADERVKELFSLVGIDPKRTEEYPHQFSGGMKQRANIAMALALNPSLIIADEPTTALDVIVQDQIFQRILGIQKQLKCSILLITHDIALVAENCDKMAVMYAGKIMEYSDVHRIFNNSYHPYTLGLRNAFPNINRSKSDPLVSIPKSPPSLVDPPIQCRFCFRCPFSTQICWEEEPGMTEIEPNHFVSCHHLSRVEEIRKRAAMRETWETGDEGPSKERIVS
jgi:oligopeptide/dipeptide ABC transporter ATP-binding protein